MSTSAKLLETSRLYAASSSVLASEISVATVGASFAPDTVITTSMVSESVPSDTVRVNVSVPEPSCPSASVSASVLDRV